MTERLVVVIPSRGLDALLAVSIQRARLALDEVSDRVSGHIVVVDNATERPYRLDDLVGADRVLRCDMHRSFSEASNLGATVEPSDLILLLNNDVLLHRMALVGMLDLLRDPGVGIVGARMVYPDATIQHCGVVFLEEGPRHDHVGVPSRLVPRMPRFLQCVTGAALLIRTSVFEHVGGLCEEYPFGYEDVELCLRVRQLGYRIACAQTVDSIHFQSLTPGRVELDLPSRHVFLERWRGRWSVDAELRSFGG